MSPEVINEISKQVLTTPEPLQRLQVSGLVPGGTPVPPKRETREGEKKDYSKYPV